MYLKVLCRIGQQYDVVRVRNMASGLGVSPGAVSAVLKNIEQTALVRRDRNGFVILTPFGTAVAECVLRRFETTKAWRTNVLGLDRTTAEVDACTMEHAVILETANRMERMVGLSEGRANRPQGVRQGHRTIAGWAMSGTRNRRRVSSRNPGQIGVSSTADSIVESRPRSIR